MVCELPLPVRWHIVTLPVHGVAVRVAVEVGPPGVLVRVAVKVGGPTVLVRVGVFVTPGGVVEVRVGVFVTPGGVVAVRVAVAGVGLPQLPLGRPVTVTV